MSYSEYKPRIGVLGSFQNGKSTLVNCLLGDFVARPGSGLSTTKRITNYRFGEVNKVIGYTQDGSAEELSLKNFLEQDNPKFISFDIEMWKPILEKVTIVDTPGFNANEADTNTLEKSLYEISYAIFVINNNKAVGAAELDLLDMLNDYRIPFVIVMNCTDTYKWAPFHEENINLAKDNEGRMQILGFQWDASIEEQHIHISNFAWFSYATDILSKQMYWEKELHTEFGTFSIMNMMAQKEFSFDSKSLIEASGILPIRHFLSNGVDANNKSDYVKWKSWSRKILRDYQKKLSS